jgi:2-polyprenyl-3-methyl-5-hydroxy-6-metoxy-1,4-benzoquinol methylase
VRDLVEVTAARCDGRTLVLGRDTALLLSAVEERGLEAVSFDLRDGSPHPGGAFDTVVVSGLLEHMEPDTGAKTLSQAWNLLRRGGRLVVNVPNENVGDAGPVRRFNRKTLTRTLRVLGKPKLCSDQPFRWLCMSVAKPKDAKRLDRAKRSRFRVTARLCRGRVIELGCGRGHLAQAISDRGLEVIGVEVNERKIREAREFYPELEFLHADIRDLDLDGEAFDTAVLAEVIEHVPEEIGEEMLAVAWRLLRPGGTLIVSVPNEDCVPHRNHVREFDRRSLKRLLQPLGRPRLITDQPFKWLMMVVRKA